MALIDQGLNTRRAAKDPNGFLVNPLLNLLNLIV
jgi:hypothetical protein